MNPDLKTQIQTLSEKIYPKIKSYREHLHQHPELSYEEFATMAFVAEKLKELGIPFQKGIAETGIVALIRGDHHTQDEHCLGLRADMDALPIQEENDVTYRSKTDGIMHACGHDVHTSILLGVAEILQTFRNNLTQPVKLIFQPGEEKNPGGASLMIQEGVLENPSVDRMVALHVFPEMETGKVGFKEGIYMASCDEIYITINGKGGHGALPHNCIDPIMIGANLLVQLQQIVSRKCDPKTPCVLSFGHFEALGATNVIPSKASLKGTFRTMDEKWRAEALELIQYQTKIIVEAHGGKVDIEISHGYPYLENDPEFTRVVKNKAIEIVGSANVEELPIRLTAEDFSFYSHKVPVCFFRLGVADSTKPVNYGVHHPQFDIDPNSLLTGMQVLSSIAF
jgi:amidohydrolase